MSLSRWKMMAGVLGVSLGGLAAFAGQCPKSESKRLASRQADPPSLEVPMLPGLPPAGGSATKLPPTPPPAPAPMLPTVPSTPSAPSVDLPPPPAADLPALPPPGKPAVSPVKVPDTSPPSPATPVIPASGTDVKPLLPPQATSPEPPRPSTNAPVPATEPTRPSTIPSNLPPEGRSAPQFPSASGPGLPPPSVGIPSAGPPSSPGLPQIDPLVEPSPAASRPSPVATQQARPQNKYRILLRVGEGDPTFEVKSGDDLILKVICEKIDIKSPEKGGGPSAVKASGKVRFAGFGAEGTCEELSFLAGTGEVSLTGAVKIQVKDKLGRVESELSTETMKYRIDPSAALTGRP